MLELGNISLSVFSYVTEEKERVVQAIRNCLPTKLRKQNINKTSTQSQFSDLLVIYTYFTEKNRNLRDIISYLAENLDEKSKDYLRRNFEKKISLETKTLYLRLDKFKAFEEELFITEGSDVIKLEIGYLAYTHEQNSLENVRTTFEELGII